MCGINGIIDFNGVNLHEIVIMNNVIRHRGPDDEGYFISDLTSINESRRGQDTTPILHNLSHINESTPNVKLAFGHRRLSIIDLSEHGHQPMISNNKNVIVYNGEIYNYLELKSTLEFNGIRFHTNTDTEVILKAYEYWGCECINKFMGMWAFCIYDVTKRILFCSRDRFAIKPLYFSSTQNSFAFSSEAKSILQLKCVSKSVNLNSLYEYFTYNTIYNSSETLFSEIFELPAGHNLIYDINTKALNVLRYYDLQSKLTQSDVFQNDYKSLLANFDNLLEHSILLHLRSDVEIGSCLSGGLDSSAIVSICNKLNSNLNHKTFSAVYIDKNIDESSYINAVVNSIPKLSNYKVTPTPKDLLDNLEKIIWHQDFPIASTSIFAQWEVMKKINRLGVKVVLDGQGADEVLGGYSYFPGAYLYDLLKDLKIYSFFHEMYHIKKNKNISIVYEILRSLTLSLPKPAYKMLRTNSRVGNAIFKDTFNHSFRKENDLKLSSFLDHSVNSIKYGLKELLRYEDRNSMAFSIESRVPFLDHNLVEFSLSLPSNLKLCNGWTKYPIRNSINNKLPNSIAWRKDKLGFVTPQAKWTQELSNEISQILNSFHKLNDIINLTIVNEQLSKKNISLSVSNEIWKTVSFVKWYNLFINN